MSNHTKIGGGPSLFGRHSQSLAVSSDFFDEDFDEPDTKPTSPLQKPIGISKVNNERALLESGMATIVSNLDASTDSSTKKSGKKGPKREKDKMNRKSSPPPVSDSLGMKRVKSSSEFNFGMSRYNFDLFFLRLCNTRFCQTKVI
jgi:hypothetical protein